MFVSAAINTKDLGHHRLPGVCISIFGFLLVFIGIMMLGINSATKDQTEANIRVGGPACVAIGGAAVIGGFTLQFILHRKHKRTLQRIQKAREKIIESQKNNQTADSAQKYVSDTQEIVSYPSTSGDGMTPAVTIETLVEDEIDYYERQFQDYNYLSPDTNRSEFLDFSPSQSSYDDSSEEEVSSGPNISETQAVIEYKRRQSMESTSSWDSTKAPGDNSSSHQREFQVENEVPQTDELSQKTTKDSQETKTKPDKRKKYWKETFSLPAIREKTPSFRSNDNLQTDDAQSTDFQQQNDNPKVNHRRESAKSRKKTHTVTMSTEDMKDIPIACDPTEEKEAKPRVRRRSHGTISTSWVTTDLNDSFDSYSLSSSLSEQTFKNLPCVETPRSFGHNGQSSPSISSSLSGSQETINESSVIEMENALHKHLDSDLSSISSTEAKKPNGRQKIRKEHHHMKTRKKQEKPTHEIKETDQDISTRTNSPASGPEDRTHSPDGVIVHKRGTPKQQNGTETNEHNFAAKDFRKKNGFINQSRIMSRHLLEDDVLPQEQEPQIREDVTIQHEVLSESTPKKRSKGKMTAHKKCKNHVTLDARDDLDKNHVHVSADHVSQRDDHSVRHNLEAGVTIVNHATGNHVSLVDMEDERNSNLANGVMVLEDIESIA